MTEIWSTVPPIVPLSGSEQFSGIDATVSDFWAFAMSDLKMNNVRGYLAEFLVARATGALGNRVEWDAYDIITPEKVTIEVKSSAYLQAWSQRRPSRIAFSGLKGRTWTPEGGESAEATYNADVYVFCVETAIEHEQFNPLDTSQWDFYVVPRATVVASGYKGVGLPTLLSWTGGPVDYTELAERIRLAGPNAQTVTEGSV